MRWREENRNALLQPVHDSMETLADNNSKGDDGSGGGSALLGQLLKQKRWQDDLKQSKIGHSAETQDSNYTGADQCGSSDNLLLDAAEGGGDGQDLPPRYTMTGTLPLESRSGVFLDPEEVALEVGVLDGESDDDELARSKSPSSPYMLPRGVIDDAMTASAAGIGRDRDDYERVRPRYVDSSLSARPGSHQQSPQSSGHGDIPPRSAVGRRDSSAHASHQSIAAEYASVHPSRAASPHGAVGGYDRSLERLPPSSTEPWSDDGGRPPSTAGRRPSTRPPITDEFGILTMADPLDALMPGRPPQMETTLEMEEEMLPMETISTGRQLPPAARRRDDDDDEESYMPRHSPDTKSTNV